MPWTHPRFGPFKYDVVAWLAPARAPAFDAFTYDSGFGDPAPNGQYELAFDADDEDDLPSPAAIELADRILTNAAALVPKVTAALWDDFGGRGPHSGMWWHDALDEIFDDDDDAEEAGLTPPTKAADLLKLLRLTRIAIRKPDDNHSNGQLLAELSFSAAFEEEHGVGVLTDGHQILGTGYSNDASPFDGA